MPAIPQCGTQLPAPSASIRCAHAAAVRTLPRTARLMPMNPVSPDKKQPSTTPRCGAPDSGTSRDAAVGVLTAVEVANTTTASGTKMTAIVLTDVSGRPLRLPDRERDPLHLRRALIFREHLPASEEADADREQRRDRRAHQDRPLTSTQVELLVRFGSE